APHAAAIAGLIKAAAPILTPAEIRATLTSTALDIEAPSVDRDSGFGIVMAFQALEAIGAQPAPTLNRGTVTATPVGGDGDSFIEPGESGALSVELLNIGGATATNVSATLTTATPGVTITQATSTYPDIPPAGSAVNATPFTFSLAPTAPCGLLINFTLTVTYDGGGSSPQVFNFNVETGQQTAPATVSYTGPPVPIPDGSATGVNIPFQVSGLNNIGDLNFRIDGSQCTSAQGATTVGLDHSWVGDLVITLTSPQGTSVTLMNRPGGTGNSGNNFCQTLLDDEVGSPSIQSIQPTGTPPLGPPYTGTFTPASPLAAFKGQDPNGTWVLNVRDLVITDFGNVRAFSLIITGVECDAVSVPILERGTVTTTPVGGDNDPFIEPGESGALSVQVVNNGAATATDVSATLTSSTPGVTITQATSTYPDIPPAGSAVNTTPFTFSLAADAPCGLLVNFTLTVTYAALGSPQVLNFTVQTGGLLTVNGGFETGDFTGWTTPVITGGSGSFLVRSGTALPLSGLTTVGPRSGTFYAVNDQTGPGTHALLQTFTVPAGVSAMTLSFDMFANNYGSSTIVNPIGLDHRRGPNQHARVDILSAEASPFDTGAGVLRNFYLGADPGSNPHPYTHYDFDITDLVGAGGTFQLRFAVTNNQFFFNQGVDNVSISIECGAPPPTTMGLRGEYYDNIDFTNLKLTRVDPTVNFDFGEGSPDPSIEPDTFSVRWTGQVQPEFSETYTFYTVSDDGVRLTINGQVVIDNLTDHAPTEDSGTITLVAGQRYDIQMEFYENAIVAVAQLLWSSASQEKQVIPQNRLFPAN
ncbi:MAG: PA14 domain-containing protein, partial [Acidobacteriota bacterium]|nr:PA14 domain-containing protein [Acidobacteriota bacterium]